MNYKELNLTLSNLRTKKLEIDRLQKKVINLGEALGYKSPTYEEKVQTSTGGVNKTEDEQYAFLAIKQEYKNKLVQLELEQIYWNTMINQIPESKYRLAIQFFYWDAKKLSDVADELGYDYCYMRRIKTIAVNKLLRILNKNSQKS